MYAIEIVELPQERKEGDVLTISDSGESLALTRKETAARRSKNKKMQDNLWE